MSEEKAGLYEKLSYIQNEMNVPKNLFNKFGNYYYRNAESILESAKPICKKYRTTLTIEDRIIEISGRFYIESIARLTDWDSDSVIENKAYAREADQKKGMDESQVTGSCSSYARKYALNGLFNLDDVKDVDSEDNTEKGTAKTKPQTKSQSNVKTTTKGQINTIIDYTNENANFKEYIVKQLNGRKLKDIPAEEAAIYVAMIARKKGA